MRLPIVKTKNGHVTCLVASLLRRLATLSLYLVFVSSFWGVVYDTLSKIILE